MEFQKQTDTHAVKRKIFGSTAEQAVDSDITLPEYYPDIAHVLKCSVQPQIYTVQTANDKITVEGAALLRILYCSEEKEVRCFEQTVPFFKTTECTLPEEAFAKGRAKTEYVNCRVLSPRKMDIHGAISLSLTAYIIENESVICDCIGGGMQIQTQKAQTSALLGATEKIFSLQETLELGEAKPAVGEILRTDAETQLQSVKLVSGKALLKGSLSVKTVYLCEGGTGSVETMTHSMPISQIVEIEGAEEEGIADTELTVTALQLVAKPDAGGALRLLDAKASISVSIDIYKEKEETLLLDAYSTEYEIQTEEKNLELQTISDRFTDTHLCRGTVDFSGCDVKEILSVRCTDIAYTPTVAEGAVRLEGTAQLEIMYCSTQGEWGVLDHKLDFNYSRNISMSGESLSANVHVCLSGVDYLLNAADKMEVRVELEMEALLLSKETRRVLSDISLLEDRKKTGESAALTIYFANGGEMLWDIARQYNTTVPAIQKENGLQGEKLEDKCTLLIPRV